MPDREAFHMTPNQFRQYGKQVIDWIADYYERVESLPVLSQVSPGEVRRTVGRPGRPVQTGPRSERQAR